MSDLDLGTITDAFEEFRVSQTPTLKPAGLAPVRAVARRRREVRTVALSVLAAALVLLPIAAYAEVSVGHHRPPVTGPSVLPPARPTPYPSVSTGNPSAAPSTAVMPSAGPSGCVSAGAGRADICNATLDIPALAGVAGCPSGKVPFTAGTSAGTPFNGQLTVSTVGTADVDHDGVPETVALVDCSLGQAASLGQVLAFRKDGSTLGRVVATEGPITGILDVAIGPGGAIRAEVSNSEGTQGWSYWVITLQWRTYGWTGQGFAQTGGSTSFTADHASADLTVTVAPLVFPKPQAAVRQANLTITVHNRGTRPAAQLSLLLYFVNATVSGPGVEQSDSTAVGEQCPVGTLAPGATWQRTLTLAITPGMAAPRYQSKDDGGIQLRLGDQVYSELHTFTVTYQ